MLASGLDGESTEDNMGYIVHRDHRDLKHRHHCLASIDVAKRPEVQHAAFPVEIPLSWRIQFTEQVNALVGRPVREPSQFELIGGFPVPVHGDLPGRGVDAVDAIIGREEEILPASEEPSIRLVRPRILARISIEEDVALGGDFAPMA